MKSSYSSGVLISKNARKVIRVVCVVQFFASGLESMSFHAAKRIVW